MTIEQLAGCGNWKPKHGVGPYCGNCGFHESEHRDTHPYTRAHPVKANQGGCLICAEDHPTTEHRTSNPLTMRKVAEDAIAIVDRCAHGYAALGCNAQADAAWDHARRLQQMFDSVVGAADETVYNHADPASMTGHSHAEVNRQPVETSAGCQHDLLRPDTTIEVIDAWKARCKVCINFFDLPGRPENGEPSL